MTMKTPPVVSAQEWETARQQLLVKEKELTRARDALAAQRRRMPWLAVEKAYEFDGPEGKASLLDLFEGRRQLVIYRAFFEPGVLGWPDHACHGCSMMADQVAHVTHLNARDTTFAYASRAPQPDIARLKARMGWTMPWYTVTGDWDFIAIVRVREHDDLAKVVTQHLTRLDGIERTQTMVAFQQFSAHDLEAMFGLGLEDKKA